MKLSVVPAYVKRLMMTKLKYKNFIGSIEHDEQGYHGKILEIDDLVTYQATSHLSLIKEFEIAVDDYLETKRKLNF